MLTPSEPELCGLPKLYFDYADVLSKQQAETFPPHRSHDCQINLLPGTVFARSRVYPLSLLETDAMSYYIKVNLAGIKVGSHRYAVLMLIASQAGKA